MENYLGSLIKPNKGSNEQLEEGRRYLKKIFNVYWNLPQFLPGEFRNKVDAAIKAKGSRLENVKPKKIYQDYINKYYFNNLREVDRFLEVTAFNMDLLEFQLKRNKDSTILSYFENVKKESILLVRIQLIQDLCFPLYQEILNTQGAKLIDLETMNEDGRGEEIDIFLKEIELTSSQISIAKDILLEEDRFYKKSARRDLSILPFLSLNADKNLGDFSGITSDKFRELLSVGDIDTLKNSIYVSSKNNLQNCIEKSFDYITSSDDGFDLRGVALKALFKVSGLSKSYKTLHDLIKEQISKERFDISVFKLNMSNIDEKKELESNLLLWADKVQLNETQTKKMLKDVPFFTSDIEYLGNLSQKSEGVFSEKAVVKGWVDFFDSNNEEALNFADITFEKFNPASVSYILKPFKENFKQNFNEEGNSDLRNKKLNFFKKYSILDEK